MIKTEYINKKLHFCPTHPLVKSWSFPVEDDKDMLKVGKAANEATLANSLAQVAEDNGVSTNELQHIFPAILRMLKAIDSPWSGIEPKKS